MGIIEKEAEDSDRNLVLDLGLFVIFIVVLGLTFTSVIDSSAEKSGPESSEPVMPSTDYNVTSQGVFPYEHTVRPGERFAVHNSMEEELTLYSESVETRTVDPGGHTVYSLDRITYFEANTSDGRVGRFKANIQR